MNTEINAINIKKIIQKLIAKKNLSQNEAYKLFKDFNNISEIQQATILTLLSVKHESIEELSGALQYILEQSQPISCDYPITDIVGTGGDGIGTFNISTTASLMLASAGAYVAKHGGRAATSQSGSADVLEHLGIPFYDSQQTILESLEKYHYTYLWAPLFNPALKASGALRKQLPFPTIFNILGPLANPMRPQYQVIGVYRRDLVLKLAEILKNTGSQHAMIVHSEEGLDEFSISNITYVAELKNNTIREYTITPEDVGLTGAHLSTVLGGTPAENAVMIQDILSGKNTGAPLDIVLLNTAAGLVVSNLAQNLQEGVNIARTLITSKQAYHLLNNLKNIKI